MCVLGQKSCSASGLCSLHTQITTLTPINKCFTMNRSVCLQNLFYLIKFYNMVAVHGKDRTCIVLYCRIVLWDTVHNVDSSDASWRYFPYQYNKPRILRILQIWFCMHTIYYILHFGHISMYQQNSMQFSVYVLGQAPFRLCPSCGQSMRASLA